MRKKKKISGRIVLLLFAGFIITLGILGANVLKDQVSYPAKAESVSPDSAKVQSSSSPVAVVKEQSTNVGSIDIHSTHAVLLDLKSGEVLYSKASDQKTYPASITKIMTAILAIENIPNLQNTVSLSKQDYQQLVKENASMAGFLPNEKVKAIDLLYGTLLPSGADAATALADKVSGSQSQFVDLMNQKAKKLGMNHSHFTNVTGLHNPDHYTTVSDLSILLRYALKNTTFRKAFTAKSYSTSPTNMNSKGITCFSTLFQKIGPSKFGGVAIIGGKTGFTDEAGLCLASLAKKGDQEYIFISTDADGNHNTEQYDIEDAKKIYSAYLA